MPTLDRYVSPLKLPMSIDLFSRFPHVPAYKAEFRDGHAELIYRPRLSMARLAVKRREVRPVAGVGIRPLDVEREVDALAKLFTVAFQRVPPLDVMPPTTRRHAADTAMKNTAAGGDGDLFSPACFAANDSKSGELIGAAIVCKIGLRSDEWPDDTLPDTLVNLTWLFVTPKRQRCQIASALLDSTANALFEQRVPWLVSHMLEDNSPSVLFHWRRGFELVPATVRR